MHRLYVCQTCVRDAPEGARKRSLGERLGDAVSGLTIDDVYGGANIVANRVANLPNLSRPAYLIQNLIQNCLFIFFIMSAIYFAFL